MSADGDDLAYWRALAVERGRELEVLRARFLRMIDQVPDAIFPAFAASLDPSVVPWLREIHLMAASATVENDDVLDVLDELWHRVAASEHPIGR